MKWSVTLTDRLGPEMLTVLEINGQVHKGTKIKGQLHLFINSVNSFHPALKYTWEISENSLVFLDIKISINDNGLSTSVHYKPTDSHNYLLHSSSHPQHVKNAIPFSQLLRLRRLCSDDADFNNKCEEMCQFFKKRGYPDSAVTTGKHRAQEIDRETALQTSQNEETDRIPFTLTYHPQNLAIKNVILKNFKILRNDPETKHIFSLPPLISFKRDKNLGNFLVRSAFKFNNKPGTFTCKRTRCKTCPFLRTQSIRQSRVNINSGQSHRPFYLHLLKCHLLHNLHAMQENLHRRNREETGGPLPRTPTRRRTKQHRCVQTSRPPFQSS